MPIPALHLAVDDPAVVEGLARIRADFDVPGPHPSAAVAEAEAAADRVLGSLDADDRRDARDIELVTVDPPGSRDLDQALHLERREGGWRVHYAIADVAAFVEPGGALDRECRRRGLTFYLPDARAPLHPPVLGEGAGSLLPDVDRPCVLWTVDLDGDGAVRTSTVERAVVRSRAQLTYEQVQADVDAGTAPPSLLLLRDVGLARLEQEAARGGVSLDLPAQRVESTDGGYRIAFEARVEAMAWNAQLSLVVGMVAAERMIDAQIGLLRTLPPPDPEVVERLRRTAAALGVDWPDRAGYADVVRRLRSDDPDEAALLAVAARGLRGAGYLALPGSESGAALEHAAVAAPYAHVTAPLRRLADRYATEACLAAEAGDAPPEWVAASLADLPDAMNEADARESGSARAVVDLVEALVLRPLVGQILDVTVTAADEHGSTVICRDPAVQARVEGHRLGLGEAVQVRVVAADPVARRVELEPA